MFEIGDAIHHKIFKFGKVVEVKLESRMLLVDWKTHRVVREPIEKTHVKMTSVEKI